MDWMLPVLEMNNNQSAKIMIYVFHSGSVETPPLQPHDASASIERVEARTPFTGSPLRYMLSGCVRLLTIDEAR